ncbi:META domain-containing protein [Maridesulfovibrio sp.]|uniref:META domain-containing protein n=1 Tax=Maridesulfovibrio sp. TaxID=2795000 RepID=UPI002A189681|nr:META domain-containing protein [Maridesulfovibrio sp.]
MNLTSIFRPVLLILFIFWALSLFGCAGHGAAPEPDFVSTRDTKWVLVDLNGHGLVDFAHIWVRFDSDGKIYGSGGCNSFRGHYSIENKEFRTGPLAMTRKACSGSLAAQEFEFMEALESARLLFRRNGLLFMEGGGHVMEFSDSN